MTRKNTLLILLTAGAGWLSLTSYSSGPGNGGLGDLSGTNCGGSGCHAANSSATVVQNVVLVDVGGGTPTPTGQYIPGRTYAVSILGSLSPASTALTHFGFQTTARNGSNATVGSINLSGTSQIQTYTASGRTGVEHSSKIPKNSGGFFTKTWQWTAPAAGTGPVTFYTIINAVNNNSTVTGDQPNAGTTVFTEAPLSVDDIPAGAAISIYPNPATDRISIRTQDWKAGDYTISVWGINGSEILRSSVTHGGQKEISLALPAVSPGLYVVRVMGAGGAQYSPLFIQ